MRFRRLTVAAALSLVAPALVPQIAAVAAAAPVVTLLGDSITAGHGLAAADALPAQLQAALARRGVAVTVRGAGVSGDTTGGGLERVGFSVAPDTRLCVVELGGNDYLQSVPPAETAANLDAIVRALKARHIGVLLLGGQVPAHSTGGYGPAFDAIFPAIARSEHVALDPDFLAGVQDRPDLKQADGLHPNPAGVVVMANRIAPYVEAALKDDTQP